jgi:tRNA(fMet)-specific endonuclease VapC
VIYALDTDTFTHLAHQHQKVAARFTAVVTGGTDQVTIPAGVRAELLRGRFDALTKAATGQDFLHQYRLLVITEQGLAPFRILEVTAQAATTFDTLLQNKKLAKRSRSDLLIASVALAHHATLVTANTRHFANIPGLKVEDWTL